MIELATIIFALLRDYCKISRTRSVVELRTQGNLNKFMPKIKGNRDGKGGRNESYQIGTRKQVSRKRAVKEVEAGDHPGAHVVKVNRQKYVRDNPDSSKKDNVNRE